MTWAEITIRLVVVLVGLPAALSLSALLSFRLRFRNVTALALVASWFFGQGVWLATGDNLPLRAYVMADITVIFAIYAKTIARCGPKTYRDGWHQLRCMITDLTPWDRWIIATFLPVWAVYVLSIGDFAKWYLCWALTIAQFLFAGAEALHLRREAKRAVPVAEPDIPSSGGFMRLAGVGGYG